MTRLQIGGKYIGSRRDSGFFREVEVGMGFLGRSEEEAVSAIEHSTSDSDFDSPEGGILARFFSSYVRRSSARAEAAPVLVPVG